MKILAYLKSTMRLTTSIFLAACAFALVSGIGVLGYNYWEKSRAKEFEAAKLWTVDLRNNLQFSLSARTKLVDNQFLIKIETDAYPQYLKDPVLSSKNADQVIVLNFVDKDGFKVFSKSVEVKELSTTLDPAGQPVGLSFEDDEYMDVRTYSSFARLEAQWTLDTVVASTERIAAKPEVEIQDHCAPNLSKAERLRRLAQHGAVRQTGDGSYAVGYRRLTFFNYDNSLIDCG